MNKDFKLDLEKDFTEEEMAAIQPPEINLHSKEEQIIDLYTNSDKTVTTIANELKVSTRTIYEVLAAKRIKLKNAKASVQARVAKIPADDKAEVVALYKNTRMKVEELMELLDVNKPTLYAILDEAGAPRRKSSKEVEVNDTITELAAMHTSLPGLVQFEQVDNELRVTITKHAQSAFSKVTLSYEV